MSWVWSAASVTREARRRARRLLSVVRGGRTTPEDRTTPDTETPVATDQDIEATTQ
ncbi:hypothetical protein [Kitasatospora sp. NPDC050543]|uniref:hypothetical protein n=1 Tax=Kitasatospora sp. NPDC050543 TaxID=3364054 RepID=UPI0037A3EC41